MSLTGTLRGFGMILVGCLFLAGCSTDPESGAADPRAAVDAYIAGLNTSDYQSIARLAPPLNDPSADIRKRLAAYGGKDIKLTAVDIRSEITPKAALARLDGIGKAGKYSETLSLERKGDRWFIALGRNPNLPSDQMTASTTRPG
ncbi:hypothetical protein ACFXJ8_43840 [Nonomuraea sp. NPDC059194]|uniref:hypothetical protein n=1 Tax=Nonomuraea sp. NPDC059194 TaxID=3346764 RepID=UPI00368451CB